MIITLDDVGLIEEMLDYHPEELYDRIQELIEVANQFESVEITIKLTNPQGS